jgi:hypothetical protein
MWWGKYRALLLSRRLEGRRLLLRCRVSCGRQGVVLYNVSTTPGQSHETVLTVLQIRMKLDLGLIRVY